MNIKQACRSLIRVELAQYDKLSQPARLRYERALSQYDHSVLSPNKCAHGVELVNPCVKCERDDDDCRSYRVAAQFQLRELIKILEAKSSV